MKEGTPHDSISAPWRRLPLSVVSAFSKRHRRALAEERLALRLGSTVRGRVRRLLERYSRSYVKTTERNWNYETDTLQDLAGELRDLYGADHLPGDGPQGLSIRDYVADAPAECVFDALELFAAHEEALGFAAELNEVLAEEEVPWRLLDGTMVLLDDTFARSELAGRADSSFRQAGFSGASAELRRARHHVTDGDGRGAVHRAGSAYESVAMALLGKDRGTAAKLLQDLSRDGFFDGLPVKLRERFVREVLEALPWMRNNLGGHGQGEIEAEVPAPYAQLAVDLSASLSNFLITLKLDREGASPPIPGDDADAHVSAVASEPADLADFSSAAGSEDDIPF